MKLTNPELIVKRSYKEVYKDGDKIQAEYSSSRGGGIGYSEA